MADVVATPLGTCRVQDHRDEQWEEDLCIAVARVEDGPFRVLTIEYGPEAV
jgi:hypothetical protein